VRLTRQDNGEVLGERPLTREEREELGEAAQNTLFGGPKLVVAGGKEHEPIFGDDADGE
jgi:hypothetical protein